MLTQFRTMRERPHRGVGDLHRTSIMQASAPICGVDSSHARLFGDALELCQRIGRSADEQSAQHPLYPVASPTWREFEISVKSDAARGIGNGSDYDILMVNDPERQANIEA